MYLSNYGFKAPTKKNFLWAMRFMPKDDSYYLTIIYHSLVIGDLNIKNSLWTLGDCGPRLNNDIKIEWPYVYKPYADWLIELRFQAESFYRIKMAEGLNHVPR